MKPESCQLCGKKFEDGYSFVDGKTVMGPWTNMCVGCHKDFGVGLGIGRGQEYDWTSGKKIAG